MVATFGLKFALPSSIVFLVLLLHLGVKLRIALLLSTIIIFTSTLKPLSELMNKLLSVKVFYLAKTPVIILSPLFIISVTFPTVIAIVTLAPLTLEEMGICVKVFATPLSLRLSILWNETQVIMCPARIAKPDFWIALTLLGMEIVILSFIILPLSLAGLRYVDGKLWPLFYLKGPKLKWFAVQLAFNAAYALTIYFASFKALEITGIATSQGILHTFSIILPIIVLIAPPIDEKGIMQLQAILIPLSPYFFLSSFIMSLKP